MTNIMKSAIALVAMFGLALPAAAQEQPISLAGDVMLVKVETSETGESKTTLVEPGVIVPGDRLIFGTDYANSGAQAVNDFVVTNPVPSPVRLASDADPELTVSVDGGKNWGKLGALTVTSEAGEARAAAHTDVTHVRWVLSVVKPGEKGRLEYPAIIR
ncbi:MAG: hypothetical protein ABJ242_11585 [Marinomonas sp.]